MHMHQVATDLQAEYFPLKSGSVHLGMLRNATWIIDHHLRDLMTWCRRLPVLKIICAGHSLGSGIATILTFLLEGAGKEVEVRMWGMGTPPVVSKELAEEFGEYCMNFIYESDIVPRLSYGTVLDFRDMLIESAHLCHQKLPDTLTFPLLTTKRHTLLTTSPSTRLQVPGHIHHLHTTIPNLSRRQFHHLQQKGEIPHVVVEVARPEQWHFVGVEETLFMHHMPWEYDWAIREAREWMVEMKRLEELRGGGQ
ncbi:Alpha/Beta hydrolase protein [Chytridium lagenaria]|nr:Alpha/Beta hydrolase protein [Chytridium lagenaria]